MMQLTVNGKSVEAAATTVTKLLVELDVKNPDQVAVELNGEIVDRGAYDETRVNEGDQLEFLYFMGGGRGTQ
jgi:sulfur carrier protein